MRLILLCVAITAFSAWLHAADENAPKTDQAREKDKEDVIRKIEDLLVPTSPLIQSGKDQPEMAPYFKIIPGSGERSTVIYRCRNVKSKAILDAIEGMVSTSGTVEESADQNMVVINDVSTKTEDFKNVLLAMDVKNPQVLVEAKIVEVLVDEGMQRDVQVEYNKFDAKKGLTSTYGYSLSAPTQNPLPDQGSGFNFYPYSKGTAGGSLKDLNLFVKWLKTTRDAKVLSSPNLIVDLGTTASTVSYTHLTLPTIYSV